MKSYRITVIEITADDGCIDGHAATSTEIFTQRVNETDFNLRAVINAINTKPRIRRSRAQGASVKPVPMGPLFSEPFKEAAK